MIFAIVSLFLSCAPSSIPHTTAFIQHPAFQMTRNGLSYGRALGATTRRRHISISNSRPNNNNGSLQMAPPVIEEDLNGDTIIDVTANNGQLQSDSDDVQIEPLIPRPSSSSTSTGGIISVSSTRQLPTNWLGEKSYILFTATLIGLFTGTNIAVFKTAVEFVREAMYGNGIKLPMVSPLFWNSGGEEIFEISVKAREILPLSAIPVVGGLIVSALLRFGGDMPPGLRDTVREGMLSHIMCIALIHTQLHMLH